MIKSVLTSLKWIVKYYITGTVGVDAYIQLKRGGGYENVNINVSVTG